MLQSINMGVVRSRWIFNPVIDLLIISNCLWPLLLIPGLVSDQETGPIQFLHAYLLSSPHRWITLFLVISDSSRRIGRQNQMAGTAVSFALLILLLKLNFGYLVCLLWIDYTWNAFHFAAQHSGILAINCRRNKIFIPSYYKWLLRLVLTAIILMVPLNTINSNIILYVYEGFTMIGLALTILLAIYLRIFQSLPSGIYFMSFISIYGGILATNVLHRPNTATGLMLASSVFHSIEYFAIVSRYVITRDGCLNIYNNSSYYRVRITGFMFLMALLLFSIQSLNTEFSAAVNLWAAFFHYSFDAWIWKLKEPGNSNLLRTGVESD